MSNKNWHWGYIGASLLPYTDYSNLNTKSAVFKIKELVDFYLLSQKSQNITHKKTEITARILKIVSIIINYLIIFLLVSILYLL